MLNNVYDNSYVVPNDLPNENNRFFLCCLHIVEWDTPDFFSLPRIPMFSFHQPFTISSSSGGGNSLRDFRLNSYRGVGSVVFRSADRAHTVGVGATSASSMGRRNGNS